MEKVEEGSLHEDTLTLLELDTQEQLLNLCCLFIYLILQTYDLKVTLPGLKRDTQIIQISLLPGTTASI